MKRLIDNYIDYDNNYGINDHNLKTENYKKIKNKIRNKTLNDICCVLFFFFLAYIVTVIISS